MPFSRSRSIESMTRSVTSWWARKAPVWRSMASTSVVLPWSTCATMATLRKWVGARGHGGPFVARRRRGSCGAFHATGRAGGSGGAVGAPARGRVRRRAHRRRPRRRTRAGRPRSTCRRVGPRSAGLCCCTPRRRATRNATAPTSAASAAAPIRRVIQPVTIAPMARPAPPPNAQSTGSAMFRLPGSLIVDSSDAASTVSSSAATTAIAAPNHTARQSSLRTGLATSESWVRIGA